MIFVPFAVAMTMASAPQGGGSIVLPGCGLTLPITRRLTAALPDDRLTGGGGVLVGDLDTPTHGSVVFLRIAGKWSAYAAAPGSAPVAVFRDARSGAVFVWTRPAAQGAGQHFDALSMSGKGSDRFCTRLLYPDALDPSRGQPEMLELSSFNIDAAGQATLIGTADVEREVTRKVKGKRKLQTERQRVRLIYRYFSPDGGRRWSTPTPSDVIPTPGSYDRLTGAPAALIASLRAQAR